MDVGGGRVEIDNLDEMRCRDEHCSNLWGKAEDALLLIDVDIRVKLRNYAPHFWFPCYMVNDFAFFIG